MSQSNVSKFKSILPVILQIYQESNADFAYQRYLVSVSMNVFLLEVPLENIKLNLINLGSQLIY